MCVCECACVCVCVYGCACVCVSEGVRVYLTKGIMIVIVHLQWILHCDLAMSDTVM